MYTKLFSPNHKLYNVFRSLDPENEGEADGSADQPSPHFSVFNLHIRYVSIVMGIGTGTSTGKVGRGACTKL